MGLEACAEVRLGLLDSRVVVVGGELALSPGPVSFPLAVLSLELGLSTGFQS